MIKQRKYNKKPKKYRKKAFEIFDKELYKRFRGIIEGIFGELETRRLLFTRYKKKIHENETHNCHGNST